MHWSAELQTKVYDPTTVRVSEFVAHNSLGYFAFCKIVVKTSDVWYIAIPEFNLRAGSRRKSASEAS